MNGVVRLGVVAALAGVAVRRARRRRRPRAYVDLYYDDGSMVSLEPGAPGADRLLRLAHDALRRSG